VTVGVVVSVGRGVWLGVAVQGVVSVTCCVISSEALATSAVDVVTSGVDTLQAANMMPERMRMGSRPVALAHTLISEDRLS
jgi:hypothetical protein